MESKLLDRAGVATFSIFLSITTTPLVCEGKEGERLLRRVSRSPRQSHHHHHRHRRSWQVAITESASPPEAFGDMHSVNSIQPSTSQPPSHP